MLLVVQQFYEAEVNNEYVIRGNAAILKCSIPSFVADFVSVMSWQDDGDNTFSMETISSSANPGTIFWKNVNPMTSSCLFLNQF